MWGNRPSQGQTRFLTKTGKKKFLCSRDGSSGLSRDLILMEVLEWNFGMVLFGAMLDQFVVSFGSANGL